MRGGYVGALRVVRRALASTGLLGGLDRAARRSRGALWVRSWLAIYDLDDMLALDVPWWTFASADAVEELLHERPGARVLEWGSGASTIWLARRAGSVVSVEHDPGWAERTRAALGARDLRNVDLRVAEPCPASGGVGSVRSAKRGFEGLDFTAYVGAIDDVDGDFDLVVIDGRAREACLVRAVDRLADGGVIVFDNVDRVRYRDAIEALGSRLRVRWTRGRTPALPYPTRTALISLRRSP